MRTNLYTTALGGALVLAAALTGCNADKSEGARATAGTGADPAGTQTDKPAGDKDLGPRHLRVVPKGQDGDDGVDGVPPESFTFEDFKTGMAVDVGRVSTAYLADVTLTYDPSVTIDTPGKASTTPVTVLDVHEVFVDRAGITAPAIIQGTCNEIGLCDIGLGPQYVNSGRVLLLAEGLCGDGDTANEVERLVVRYTLPIEEATLYSFTGEPYDYSALAAALHDAAEAHAGALHWCAAKQTNPDPLPVPVTDDAHP